MSLDVEELKMENSEIDDETMMKMFDEYEKNCGNVNDSELNAQGEFALDRQTRVEAWLIPNFNELRLQDSPFEREIAQFPYEQEVVQPPAEQEVVQPLVEQEGHPYEYEFYSNPVCCHCGFAVVVVVIREGINIGRRIQQCPLWPNGCNYAEWIDDRLCRRGITYANELEQEIQRLR